MTAPIQSLAGAALALSLVLAALGCKAPPTPVPTPPPSHDGTSAVADGGPSPTNPPTIAMEKTMKVELRVSPGRVADVHELTTTVHVRNTGTAPVRLNTLLLPFPSLMLQVRDAAGKRVPLGPPPVPPIDDGSVGRQDLAPGKEIAFDYGNPFGTSPDPGRYEIRFFHEARSARPGSDWQGTLESAWVPFEVLIH